MQGKHTAQSTESIDETRRDENTIWRDCDKEAGKSHSLLAAIRALRSIDFGYRNNVLCTILAQCSDKVRAPGVSVFRGLNAHFLRDNYLPMRMSSERGASTERIRLARL